MRLHEAMVTYFQGEKIEALGFILPLGLLSLVFGGWLLSEGAGGFSRGVALPFLVMGLVMAAVGGVVGYRAPAQSAALAAAVEASSEPVLRAEGARMERVSRAWAKYHALWAIFGVVGLGLRFGTRGDLTQGLGISLVFFSGLGLLIDGFAERRVQPYAAVLRAWTPPLAAPGVERPPGP
jgi:hypothetical protein